MQTRSKRHDTSIAAILIGITAGVLLGTAYGRSMWLASGGAQRRLEKLQRTLEQKQQFQQQAQREGRSGEAARLAAQVPVIESEIHKLRSLIAQTDPSQLRLAHHTMQFVSFCGELFLRLLMLIVVPLVLTSVICGVTSLGSARQMGKVGLWTIVYYMATTAAAVTVGLILVQSIGPGRAADDTFAYVDPQWLGAERPSAIETLMEVVRGRPDDPASGMIPGNIFAAAASGNVLALIAFALLFGGALNSLGRQALPVVRFFEAANQAVMQMVRVVIRLTPIGVFGLVATQIATSGGGAAFYQDAMRLAWLVVTVVVGLAVHFVVLCAVVALVARRHPLEFVAAMAKAMLTAVSTASSSATLPVTMECVEESDVSPQTAGFVLPLGATINMDGTALYEAVAALFIAQSVGVVLGPVQVLVVFITATLAAIGAPGIPNAGLVTLLIVLAAVGLPPAGIGTVLAIDWFLDRLRTALNVFGDSVGAAVIDRYFPPPDE